MDDECSSVGWEFYCQKEGLEDLSHSLLYTTLELEATIVSAQEEITRRECELKHLNEVLGRVIQERDEAEAKCKKLKCHNNNNNNSNNSDKLVVSSSSSSFSSDYSDNEISKKDFELEEKKKKNKELLVLPEKGMLLKAVVEAGPLLQNLLLVGPLPQWQNPPPQFDSIEILPPPLMKPISPSISHHQYSNNNSSFDCFKNKRDFDTLMSSQNPL